MIPTFSITLADEQQRIIALETPELQQHFADPRNYTSAILAQFNEREYYKQFVDSRDSYIVDLGANIGLFAIYASPYASRILCVEPTPSHYTLLQQLTNSFENIETLQCAVAPVDGPVTFYTDPFNTTTNSLVPRVGRSFIVDGFTIQTLQRMASLPRIDFVKMDIEGGEDLVLTDECVNFFATSVPKVLVEFHHDVTRRVQTFAQVFQSKGYTVDIFNWDAIMCTKDIKRAG